MKNRTAMKVIVTQIVDLNKSLAEYCSYVQGWAPIEAGNLLNRSRLDWQVSLSESLKHWTDSKNLSDGDLILAWANLGSLVEGTMKLFLSVFYDDYKKDIQAIKKKGKLVDPDRLMLEQLKSFFVKNTLLDSKWIKFVDLVQQRRNAIHSFHNHNIGSYAEFCKTVSRYLKFILEIKTRFPNPDIDFSN